MTLFFAGLHYVGPTTASILSTFEPVVTVVLASAVLAEHLAPIQLIGGALMLTAVVVLRAQSRSAEVHDGAVPASAVIIPESG